MASNVLHWVFYYHRRLIPFGNKFRFLYFIKYAKSRWGQIVYIGFFTLIAGWSLLEINSDFCTLLSTLNSDGVKWFTLGFFTIIAGWSLLKLNNQTFCTLLSTLNSDGVKWFTLGFFTIIAGWSLLEINSDFCNTIKYAKFRWGQMASR